MRPINDRWFPGFRFFELCEKFGYPVPDDEALDRACSVGYEYLSSHHHLVPNENAEERQFSEYYKIIFADLKLSVPQRLIEELVHSMVKEVNFRPYNETKAVLEALAARNIPMAVLTDAWPSVRSKFRTLGYLDYFEAFVISAEEKCIKPDMGMFRPALDIIGVRPGDVLYIDDGPDLVEAARSNGFNALLMDHDNTYPEISARITNLSAILDFIP